MDDKRARELTKSVDKLTVAVGKLTELLRSLVADDKKG